MKKARSFPSVVCPVCEDVVETRDVPEYEMFPEVRQEQCGGCSEAEREAPKVFLWVKKMIDRQREKFEAEMDRLESRLPPDVY